MEETKTQLKTAFMKLYKNRDISKISIKDITVEACLYRGTFYYYYEDIYSLYNDIQSDIEKFIKEQIPPIIKSLISGNLNSPTELIEKFYSQNEDLVRLFIIEKPDQKTISQIKKIIFSILLKKFNLKEEELPEDIKYMLEYISSGQIAVITMWFKNNRNYEIEKLFGVMKICLSGVMQYIALYASKIA